jgi:D-amino peptidase
MTNFNIEINNKNVEMKIYITFDMEGVSGVVAGMTGINQNAPTAYSRGQRFSTDDVMAAIEGIMEVDPNADIYFNDAHGASLNVFFEEFPENVKVISNSAELFDEVLAIDGSFDALIGIGEHGDTDMQDAVLSHVWDVRKVAFNGKWLTEIGLDATLAGYYNVPLVMISGDDATCNYVKQHISPKIATATVKWGISRSSAICLHPKKAQKLIKNAVIDGLKRRNEISPLIFQNPVTVDMVHKSSGEAGAHMFFVPEDERLSGDTIRFIAANAKEAYFKFLQRDKLSKPKAGR